MDKALNNATLELTQRVQMYFPRDLDLAIVQAWNGCPKETFTARLREVFEKAPTAVAEAVVQLLILIKTFTIGAVTGNKTSDCFTNEERYYYRDADLDTWLPTDQPAQPESNFSVQELGQQATFLEALASIGIVGDVASVAKEIKKRGLTTTLPTIETLVERQELGQDTGLRTDGYANFFFVEDKDGGVSLVSLYRDGRQWHVDMSRLDHDNRWYVGNRFFFRNKTL